LLEHGCQVNVAWQLLAPVWILKPIVTKKSEEEKKKSIKLKNQEINSLCTCHIKKKTENRNSKVATGKLSS